MPVRVAKKQKTDLDPRAVRLNNESTLVDVHNHMMFEFAIREALGQTDIFDTYYLPQLRKGGINVIATSVGANSPSLSNMTDQLQFGVFEQIDMLRREEERSNSFRICSTYREIEETVDEGKIAVLLAFEGARAMEGPEDEESLVMLRTFHRLGLRVNCIVGAARTRFADGMGDAEADAGLTTFGVELVREMNRLGMTIDLTHMNRKGFFDVMEETNKPVLVSHIGAKAVCDNPNNLDDERIRAIGENGGVIGLEMVKSEIKKGSQETGEVVTFDDVVDHIDHIADLIGTDHIGLGLDFDYFDMVDNVHRAMCPAPGSIEGYYTGIPKMNHMLDEPNNLAETFTISDYLVRRGYSDYDIHKILGGNMMRLFSRTLP